MVPVTSSSCSGSPDFQRSWTVASSCRYQAIPIVLSPVPADWAPRRYRGGKRCSHYEVPTSTTNSPSGVMRPLVLQVDAAFRTARRPGRRAQPASVGCSRGADDPVRAAGSSRTA